MNENRNVDIFRSFAGGFFATLVMGFFMSILPQIGLPRTDVGMMLASLFNVESLDVGSGIWYMAMTAHFLIGGIVFPLLYGLFFYPRLDAAPWAKGMLFGMLIWLFNQTLMMPSLGLGFFSSNLAEPRAMVFGSLFVAMVYGGILGEIATEEGEEPRQLAPGQFSRHRSKIGGAA